MGGMCGRFVQAQLDWETAVYFHINRDDINTTGWNPSWNKSPTDTVLTVVERTNGSPGRLVYPATWSLIPTWAGLQHKYPTFNARSETCFDKPTFRDSVQRRCIIPVDGYYEWQTVGGKKLPNYLSLETGVPVCLAGLYSWWRPAPNATWQLTVTVLTRAANAHLREIHDRMPVMVPEPMIADWLAPTAPGREVLTAVSEAGCAVADALSIWRVAPLREDGPELIRPLAA